MIQNEFIRQDRALFSHAVFTLQPIVEAQLKQPNNAALNSLNKTIKTIHEAITSHFANRQSDDERAENSNPSNDNAIANNAAANNNQLSKTSLDVSMNLIMTLNRCYKEHFRTVAADSFLVTSALIPEEFDPQSKFSIVERFGLNPKDIPDIFQQFSKNMPENFKLGGYYELSHQGPNISVKKITDNLP